MLTLPCPGPGFQGKQGSGEGEWAALPAPGYPPYLQMSPSAPLSGISRHSSLSMAHCCPAAQHVSIRSFVETVRNNMGRVITLEEACRSKVSRVNKYSGCYWWLPKSPLLGRNSLTPAALHVGCQQLTALSPFGELPERLK